MDIRNPKAAKLRLPPDFWKPMVHANDQGVRALQQGSALIHTRQKPCDPLRSMTSNLHQIARRRARLNEELTMIRDSSLRASRVGDYRAVARLTLEAAEINRSITETEIQEELAR